MPDSNVNSLQYGITKENRTAKEREERESHFMSFTNSIVDKSFPSERAHSDDKITISVFKGEFNTLLGFSNRHDTVSI